jgi:hypothetical protein
MKKLLFFALLVISIYVFKPVHAPSANALYSFHAQETAQGGRFAFVPVKIHSNLSLFSVGFAQAEDGEGNLVWLLGTGIDAETKAVMCKKQRICDLNNDTWFIYIQARPWELDQAEENSSTHQTAHHVD